MEVCGVYIEKIENKGRALWVLGVFAREKEGTMPAHAGMHAHARRRWWRRRPAGRRRCRAGLGSGSGSGHGHGSGSGLSLGSGSLSGLVLFESGQLVQPARGKIRITREQIRPFANRCRKTDSAVGRLIDTPKSEISLSLSL